MGKVNKLIVHYYFRIYGAPILFSLTVDEKEISLSNALEIKTFEFVIQMIIYHV